MIWGINKVLLAVARSPVVIKIMETIGKGFSLLGGVIGALINGLVFFFSIIGRGFGSAYSSTSGLFKGAGNFNLGISIPGLGKDMFGDGKEGGEKKAAPLKLKGNKKPAAAKALPKPQNKTTVAVQAQSKFKQVTKPAPPKIKGATPLPKIGAGGGAAAGSGGAAGQQGGGNSPLGYFEDEPF